jgi:hypothetical protein
MMGGGARSDLLGMLMSPKMTGAQRAGVTRGQNPLVVNYKYMRPAGIRMQLNDIMYKM